MKICLSNNNKNNNNNNNNNNNACIFSLFSTNKINQNKIDFKKMSSPTRPDVTTFNIYQKNPILHRWKTYFKDGGRPSLIRVSLQRADFYDGRKRTILETRDFLHRWCCRHDFFYDVFYDGPFMTDVESYDFYIATFKETTLFITCSTSVLLRPMQKALFSKHIHTSVPIYI